MLSRCFLLLATALIGCSSSPPAESSGTDTITLECSCGGTWREPRAELKHWPLPLSHRGRHREHPLPEDLAEQIEAGLWGGRLSGGKR